MCIRDRYQRRVRGKKSSRIMLSQAAVACFWTLLLPMGAHANSCGDANSCYFVVFRHMHVALLAIYTTGIAGVGRCRQLTGCSARFPLSVIMAGSCHGRHDEGKFQRRCDPQARHIPSRCGDVFCVRSVLCVCVDGVVLGGF
eukprot:TRINITY_DN1861_c0_g1_i4.p2 TRINITY_DN1861_c0_g1~~TRINITY_DN1861_c0_g1_i4.p2  ORF type:complete len:142 (+),score=20.83 TRINITY_DN1861_c0_g1_i4:145-570(+)